MINAAKPTRTRPKSQPEKQQEAARFLVFFLLELANIRLDCTQLHVECIWRLNCMQNGSYFNKSPRDAQFIIDIYAY